MNTLTPQDQARATERVVGEGSETFERVRLRRDALEASGVEGLIVPARVALQSQDAVVVTEPACEGVTLGEVLQARGSLHAGECVWWAAQVAQSLASLHKVGIAHGALSADAIVIEGDRVRLGRLVDGAPEASGPDDVAALGELLTRSVRPDEAARVQAWAEPMQHDRVDARPSAAMVARAIASCAPAQPIDVPVRDVVGSMRRRASAVHEVERLPGTWWWRTRVAMRKHRRRGTIVLAGAAVLGLGVMAAMHGFGSGNASGDTAVHAIPASGTPIEDESPGDAAVRLTLSRFAAMISGDGEALIALTAPGSLARADAVATSQLFAEGRLSFTVMSELPTRADISPQVDEARPEGTSSLRTAEVIVTYAGPAYEVTLDGVMSTVDAQSVRVRMMLAWVEGVGWRVAEATQDFADASDSTT